MSTNISQNYFELFGFTCAYEIDLVKLSEIYRDLLKAVHPDRFASASNREKLLSAKKATYVNEAYNCLKSPIRRAQYLLDINNISFNDETETIQNPEFLMEQIEQRETLAVIRNSSNAIADIEQMLKDTGERIKKDQAKLADLFINSTEKNLLKAKKLVQEMQFLIKLQQEAEALEEDLVNLL